MSKVTLKDNTKKFLASVADAADKTLAAMSVDIERLSKQQVPFKDGQLKSKGYGRRVGPLRYRVGYNIEYARYQHEGGDPPKRIVRNYSYPGKKKKFLEDPGQQIAKDLVQYAKKYLGKAKP